MSAGHGPTSLKISSTTFVAREGKRAGAREQVTGKLRPIRCRWVSLGEKDGQIPVEHRMLAQNRKEKTISIIRYLWTYQK